jgi:hypothetical protein
MHDSSLSKNVSVQQLLNEPIISPVITVARPPAVVLKDCELLQNLVCRHNTNSDTADSLIGLEN